MNIFNEYGIDKFTFVEVKKKLFNDENLFNLNIIMDYIIKKYNIDIKIRYKIENLLIEEPTLEDIFLHYYK